MFPPPSAGGTIRVDSVDDFGALITRVEKALIGAKATAIRVDQDKITFPGGMPRAVSNWNILFPISCGEIHFTRSSGAVIINYRISFVGLFFVATAMILAVGIWIPFHADIIILPFAWL